MDGALQNGPLFRFSPASSETQMLFQVSCHLSRSVRVCRGSWRVGPGWAGVLQRRCPRKHFSLSPSQDDSGAGGDGHLRRDGLQEGEVEEGQELAIRTGLATKFSSCLN